MWYYWPMSQTIPMQSVGRALSRIGRLRNRGPVGAVGGDSRAAVLAFIESAEDVVRIEEISAAIGLHPNTIRGHLDALLAAGRITRIPDQRASRGRPHWLYSATSAASMRELGKSLEAALADTPAPEVATAAAAHWVQDAPELGPSGSIDEAVDQAVEVLTELGFDAVRNPVGDEISLRACPYASLVRDHPVICDIHAALLGEVLARSEQPVRLDSMDVWPRPGVCVAHLNRPDTHPLWSVQVAPPQAQNPNPQPRTGKK